MRSLRKILMRLRGTNFCTSSARIAPSFVKQPNGPECTQMVRNEAKQHPIHPIGPKTDVLASNGVDRVRWLRKNPPRLRGTNFCTSSARFPPSFLRQPNSPGCTQMVRNTPKCQFRAKWGGSGEFVAKNSDATSRPELLH